MIAGILLVAVWLLLALVVRAAIPLFAAVRIPASLIAGGIGLAVLQFAAWIGRAPDSQPHWKQWSETAATWSETLQAWPGMLIAVVFAGLLLAKSHSGNTDAAAHGTDVRQVGREGLMVWIIVLGQTAVGLWITWLVIQPLYDLPNSTGMLIETGFAGGHGTAAAMGTVFEHPSINLPAGLDLGLLMANAKPAVWLRWYTPTETRPPTTVQDTAASDGPMKNGPVSNGPDLGQPRVDGNVLDPLLFQAVWLLLAFGIGLALQQFVYWIGLHVNDWRNYAAGQPTNRNLALQERMSAAGVLSSFPLFIYTLFGGAIVRGTLRLIGQSHRIDTHTIARLVAASMDVLVVAAVATLNLTAVAALWVPFTCLFIGGAVWSTFCLLGLSRWILPAGLWFPLGLINYGMSTGTTATGFVLLRVVDPNLRSGAGEVYALAAPLSAPFIGGGMLTIALPLLVLQSVPIGASTIGLTAIVIVMILVGIRRRP